MPRPKGSKNRPGSRKPGPRPGNITEFKAQSDQYRPLKTAALDLIESEEASNLTQAAKILNVQPTLLYKLEAGDPYWAEQVKIAKNIVADKLEDKIDNFNNVVGWIFRLKMLRPEYRDSYKFDVNSTKLEQLLKELREIGQTDAPKALPPPSAAQIVTVEPRELPIFEEETSESER